MSTNLTIFMLDDFLAPFFESIAGCNVIVIGGTRQKRAARLREAVRDVSGNAILLTLPTPVTSHHMLSECYRVCKEAGVPTVYWAIEDPNFCSQFLPQAKMVDFVFTTDACCIDAYLEGCNKKAYWLPLAASPEYHGPISQKPKFDFVFSGNWYPNKARIWATETLIIPIAEKYDVLVFSYRKPQNPALAKNYAGAPSYLTTAQQYANGRIILGANNQRSGFDGIEKTVMTSMRTFEALACGKPFLTTSSDAYQALGMTNGVHLVAVNSKQEALEKAKALLRNKRMAKNIGDNGRTLVLSNHTYKHRLERILRVVRGENAEQFCYRY